MNALSPLVREFLNAAGFPEAKTAELTSKTRLMHDLHLVGDDLIDVVEVLHRKFDVDLTNFDPCRYTPGEFTPRIYLFSALPRSRAARLRMSGYDEITLEMIEAAIRAKRWPEASS